MLNANNEEAVGVIFPNCYDSLLPELVAERLMASVPFAGRYRLVDFIISSMVHSGIDDISLIPVIGGLEISLVGINGLLFINVCGDGIEILSGIPIL